MDLHTDHRRKQAASLLGIKILAEKKRKRETTKRKIWVKEWISRRNEKGAFNLIKGLRLEDSLDYRNYLRMSHETFTYILNAVKFRIEKQDTLFREAVPAAETLAVTLRFLATDLLHPFAHLGFFCGNGTKLFCLHLGETMHSLSYQFRLGLSTIHNIVYETCEAIYDELAPLHILYPQSTEDWYKIAEDFKTKWQFDHCIGALDGKHINVTAPPNSGSYFYNYKGTFSVILLALVDANAKAIFVDVGTNGRCHDRATFTNTKLHEALTKDKDKLPKPKALTGRNKPMPYVIVGDEAFTLKPNVMRPFSKHELTFQRRVFNYRLSRARRISENCFGILAKRFRILLGTIQASPENVEKIVLCICTLHNILREQSNNMLDDDIGDDDVETSRNKKSDDCSLKALQNQGCYASQAAKSVRDEFTAYFCNEGAYEKQWARLYNY